MRRVEQLILTITSLCLIAYIAAVHLARVAIAVTAQSKRMCRLRLGGAVTAAVRLAPAVIAATAQRKRMSCFSQESAVSVVARPALVVIAAIAQPKCTYTGSALSEYTLSE